MKLNIFPYGGSEENTIAKVFTVIAVLDFIGGVLGGFLLADNEYLGFMWPTFLIFVISSFIIGMLFLGFAEVIKLLQLKQTQQYCIELPEAFMLSSCKDTSSSNSDADSSKEYHQPDWVIICPKCHTKQPKDRAKCWACGYEFTESDKENSSPKE